MPIPRSVTRTEQRSNRRQALQSKPIRDHATLKFRDRHTAARARHEAVTLRRGRHHVQNRLSVDDVPARRPVGSTRPRATACSDRPAAPPGPPPKTLRIGHRRHRQAPARRARRAAVGRSAGVGRGRQHRRQQLAPSRAPRRGLASQLLRWPLRRWSDQATSAGGRARPARWWTVAGGPRSLERRPAARVPRRGRAALRGMVRPWC